MKDKIKQKMVFGATANHLDLLIFLWDFTA